MSRWQTLKCQPFILRCCSAEVIWSLSFQHISLIQSCCLAESNGSSITFFFRSHKHEAGVCVLMTPPRASIFIKRVMFFHLHNKVTGSAMILLVSTQISANTHTSALFTTVVVNIYIHWYLFRLQNFVESWLVTALETKAIKILEALIIKMYKN